ncbi:MAG: hypothetical protein JWP27_574, partial [Flaviaesturariibacter sp.]|nr:hypothetical protein [Flaviaesturariibacter sp.]
NGMDKERGTFANWAAYFLTPLDKKGKPDVELSMAWGPSNMFYYEWSPESGLEHSYYRVDYIVRQVNDVLEYRRQNPKAGNRDFTAWIDAKARQLSSKTLLVPAELLEKYDIWKITRAQMESGVGKVYTSKKRIFKTLVDETDLSGFGGKTRILPYADIERLAQSPEASQYALFSPLVNDQKYIFVFDLATKEMLYVDSGLLSMEVTKKDIKELNAKAGF